MKDEAGEVEEEGLLFDDGSLTGEAFDHTGLKRTWPAARCLARYLVSHPEEVQHKAILELGAGSGVPSLCARELGASRVVLTDAEPQVVARLTSDLSLMPMIRAALLDWEDQESVDALVREEGIEVVLAADVVYPAKDGSPLACCLGRILRRQAAEPPRSALLALTQRDAAMHRMFEAQLAQQVDVELLAIEEAEEDPLYGKADVHLYRLRAQ